MSEYGLFFSFNNEEEGFQFPINPAQIKVKGGSNGSEHDVLKLGEINIIQSQQLDEYEFNSFFPANSHPFLATNDVLPPSQYIDLINKWKESKRPVRFIFTGKSFDINTLVSIESFEIDEEAGHNGDVNFKLKLKKYVHYAAQKVKVKLKTKSAQKSKKKPGRPDNRPKHKTYRLVAGDSLWKVAQKFLGRGSRWKEIQRLNKIKDSELRRLPIGLEVKIPS